jgi:ABC-2 type transport system permease protein
VSPTIAVYRKEMRTYLVSPIPYVLAFILAGFTAWWVFSQREFFLYGTASVASLLQILPWCFMVLIPGLTMRLWSEEFRAGTFETLVTFPARPRQLVLGKFLAAWTVVAGCLVCTLSIPVTAAALGDLDPGPVIGGYLGAMLMGAAFLALGQWLSGITQNQIIALFVGIVVSFVLLMLGDSRVKLGSFAHELSISPHFDSVTRGVIDLRDMAYFVSFCGFFLYLNCENVANRRHR